VVVVFDANSMNDHASKVFIIELLRPFHTSDQQRHLATAPKGWKMSLVMHTAIAEVTRLRLLKNERKKEL
jgi:hypothetical protein